LTRLILRFIQIGLTISIYLAIISFFIASLISDEEEYHFHFLLSSIIFSLGITTTLIFLEKNEGSQSESITRRNNKIVAHFVAILNILKELIIVGGILIGAFSPFLIIAIIVDYFNFKGIFSVITVLLIGTLLLGAITLITGKLHIRERLKTWFKNRKTK
jgi:hypothetical protein